MKFQALLHVLPMDPTDNVIKYLFKFLSAIFVYFSLFSSALSRKLIPNSGITELPTDRSHYPHAEDPQGVLEAYFKFLDSLQAGEKQGS